MSEHRVGEHEVDEHGVGEHGVDEHGVGEADELRAAVAALTARGRALEDQVEIMQLVAQYGPAVGGAGR